MVNELSTIHHNTIVLLDRVELNNLINTKDLEESRREVAIKVLNRTLEYEKKHNIPCMTVRVRVYELKKLFPDYSKYPPLWWKRIDWKLKK